MTDILITLIVFFAIFTQSFTGFGLALVSMPLLALFLSLRITAPLVALVGLTAEVVILARYRDALNIRAVARLALASVPGIPLGVLLLARADEAVVLPLMGLMVTAYALYALFGPSLPALTSPRWAEGIGFFAGVLGGAYNMPGPPVIVYGTCRRWPPDEFKGNLQGFFILNSLLVAVTHAAAGNYTPEVLHGYAFALPGIALGALAGFALAARVEPARFHKIVLVLLAALGVTLIL